MSEIAPLLHTFRVVGEGFVPVDVLRVLGDGSATLGGVGEERGVITGCDVAQPVRYVARSKKMKRVETELVFIESYFDHSVRSVTSLVQG